MARLDPGKMAEAWYVECRRRWNEYESGNVPAGEKTAAIPGTPRWSKQYEAYLSEGGTPIGDESVVITGFMNFMIANGATSSYDITKEPGGSTNFFKYLESQKKADSGDGSTDSVTIKNLRTQLAAKEQQNQDLALEVQKVRDERDAYKAELDALKNAGQVPIPGTGPSPNEG
jgi:hypothetical protein